jgi:hypothetical protein
MEDVSRFYSVFRLGLVPCPLKDPDDGLNVSGVGWLRLTFGSITVCSHRLINLNDWWDRLIVYLLQLSLQTVRGLRLSRRPRHPVPLA